MPTRYPAPPSAATISVAEGSSVMTRIYLTARSESLAAGYPIEQRAQNREHQEGREVADGETTKDSLQADDVCQVFCGRHLRRFCLQHQRRGDPSYRHACNG